MIHDLAEIITGDQPYFEHCFNEESKKIKEIQETRAIEEMAYYLPLECKEELLQLWLEYHEQCTYESKIVKAIDKLEEQMQHNEADISGWNEYDRKYYHTFLNKFFDFDSTLKKLKILIQSESKKN